MQAAVVGLLICLSYSIVAVNTIAIAKRRYLATGISSLGFMVVNFFLIRHVAEARSVNEFAAYCIGGVCGDFLGIWLSKRFNI